MSLSQLQVDQQRLKCNGDGSCLKRCDHEEHRYGESPLSAYCPTNCCKPIKCSHEECDKWAPKWYHNVYGACCMKCAVVSHQESCLCCEYKMLYSPHMIRSRSLWKIKLVDKFCVLKPTDVLYQVKLTETYQDVGCRVIMIKGFFRSLKSKTIILKSNRKQSNPTYFGPYFHSGGFS